MCKICRWGLSTHQQHNSHQKSTPVGIPSREESQSQSHHGQQDHQPPGLYTTRLPHSLNCTIPDKRSPIQATYPPPPPPSRTDLYKNNFVASSSVLWNGLDAGITEAKTIEAFRAQLAPLRLIKWTNRTHDFILFLPCFYPCTCTCISYYSFTLLLSLACPRYRSRQWGLHDFPANYSHRYRYRSKRIVLVPKCYV